MKSSVIIPAGGVGKRFGSDLPKQFIELKNTPIIIHTIKQFDKINDVDSIVLAVHSEWYSFTQEMVDKYNAHKVKDIVVGGKERQDSVFNALQSKYHEESDVVLVHDAVRPFISTEMVQRVLEAAEETGAAVPAIRPKETIKEVSAKKTVTKTIDRTTLSLTQTPQGFWFDILFNAYKKAMEANFKGTDSSSLVEFIGYMVTVVEGEDSNIKITTPFDLKLGNLILDEE